MVDFPSSVPRRGEFLRQQMTCVVHNLVAVIIVVDGSGDLDVQVHQKLLHCRLLAPAHLAADDDGREPRRLAQVLNRVLGQLRHCGAGTAVEE